ncbi:putative O-methyltransferase YrrM [Rhodopirellula rubra]|uniref:Putative O-methyltransferase YrrM n=1 Tax=Aporhodopirellula rubra TaxID=980271 RepID=A0A7W5DTK1_9BACT|nr:class I SAM-dependent methyltransferase [Aporhodopirellula rubra]MBB3204281.1 putative O-methyltransferase YrrM [Aporhodopirellula rubra]
MLKNSLIGVWEAFQYDSFVVRKGLRNADKIATDMTGPEKRQLFELVLEGGPHVVVEIGSYLGASTCFMANALKRLKSVPVLYAVDTWRNDAMPEGERDTYDEFCSNLDSYGSTVQKIRSTSAEAASRFTKPIDLLFIDGDHSYEGVLNDWIAWSKHLASGATVVMHDSGWAAGVQRVIEENIRPRLVSEGSLPNMFWGVCGD